MTRILIPTDMSEGSRKAVLFALDAYGIAETEFIFLLTIGDAPKMGLFPEFNNHMKRLGQGELHGNGEGVLDDDVLNLVFGEELVKRPFQFRRSFFNIRQQGYGRFLLHKRAIV